MGATDTTSRHAARPLTLGRNGRRRITLRNRLVSAPMDRDYGTTDGEGRTHQLGLHDDATVPGRRALTDALHAEGVLAAVELSHGGRTAQQVASGFENTGPERFANLVIDVVREAAPDTVVGMRVSVVEGPEGGLDAERQPAIIGRAHLEDLDFLDLSAGSYEAGEWIVPSGESGPGVSDVRDRLTAHPGALDGSGPEPGSGQETGRTTDDRRRAAPGIGAGR